MANITQHMSASDYLAMIAGAKSARHIKPAASHLEGRTVSPKTNKYHAKRTRVGDEVFDSGKESRTYQDLLLAMQAKDANDRVVDLKRSCKYLLVPKQDGERACSYIADFVAEFADGRIDVIDTKSEITRRNPLYVLKRKLMLERHNIRIREM